MKEVVVIVAGGSGSRMASELPKQFIELNGSPILMHTIKRFFDHNPTIEIRLVLPGKQFSVWEELKNKHQFDIEHTLIEGGETRFHSVKNGLKGIEEGCLIAVHDGVRPFVSREVIARSFEASKKYGAVIPVIDVYETIRQVKEHGSETVDRNQFKLVQTPQVFKSQLLLLAYEQKYNTSFTDDASVVEAYGHKIKLVEGNRENIKITAPNDLRVAEAYFNK